MSSAAPKEYEHIKFEFNRSSGCLNGLSYEVTAYLLVPTGLLPELQKWNEAETEGQKRKDGHPSAREMYETLLDKGSLLHRENGPAYKEVEKSLFDKNHAEVTTREYWEKGEKCQAQRIKSLGKYTL
jgi:hypothetical protein